MADDREVHIDAERARAGATPHITRYVLAIGLVLIVLVFVAIYVF